MSRFRLAKARALLIGTAAWCGLAHVATAQDPADRLERAPEEVAAVGSKLDRIAPDAIATAGPIKANPRAKGTPSAGLKITLDGSATTGNRVWYRWLQTVGPKVKLDDPTRSVAHFTVPADARALGFVLVVGDASGVDAKFVQVDVDDAERDADESSLKADAGDDQASKVGKRVILNGVRSLPQGKVKYRWLQTRGPKINLRATDGPTTSFVPALPGTYQFALVVASATGSLSEPSAVTINVTGAARTAADPVDPSTMAIDELARVALASIEGGAKYSDDLSRAFDVVADRMDGFKNYTEASNEMQKRLDQIVPRDPKRRLIWIEKFVAPLTSKISLTMKGEGLDINRPEDQWKAFTAAQRSRLAEQFRYTAVGLRASRTLR